MSGEDDGVATYASKSTVHVPSYTDRIVSDASRPSVGSVMIRPNILRGVSHSKVLKGFGRLWRTSPLDMPLDRRQRLYSLSKECSSLDAFVSHAWESPWWQKYLALLVHFYWKPAAFVGLLAMVVLFTLDIAGRLPTASVSEATRVHAEYDMEMGFWCAIPPLVSLVCLVLGPFVLCGREQTIFFDAVCINQTEDGLRTEGVGSLPGFLHKSTELLVLWSPKNLSRAWCVFELAAFSALKGTQGVRWCPIFLNCLLMVQYMSATVAYLNNTIRMCANLFRFSPVMYLPLYALVGGPSILVFHLGRSFMRDKHSFLAALANFDVANAECRDECDREYIKQSVSHWYRSVTHFNKFVQGPMARQVELAMAKMDATYFSMLVVAFPRYCFGLQLLVGYYRAESQISHEVQLSLLLMQITMTFCVLPMWIKLGWIIMEVSRARLSYWFLDVSYSIVIQSIWVTGMMALEDAGIRIAKVPAASIAFAVGSALGTWLVFSWRNLSDLRLLCLRPVPEATPARDDDETISI